MLISALAASTQAVPCGAVGRLAVRKPLYLLLSSSCSGCEGCTDSDTEQTMLCLISHPEQRLGKSRFRAQGSNK